MVFETVLLIDRASYTTRTQSSSESLYDDCYKCFIKTETNDGLGSSSLVKNRAHLRSRQKEVTRGEGIRWGTTEIKRGGEKKWMGIRGGGGGMGRQ